MTQHEFDILTEKYLTGDCTLEEQALLEEWVQTQHKQAALVNIAEAEAIQQNLWNRIETSAQLQPAPTQYLPLWQWISIGVAACLLLGISYFMFWQTPHSNTQLLAQRGIESKNTTSIQQKIILPDGSTVILSKGASLITDQSFGKQNRTVYLKGEALFNIKRNEKVPFLVYTGNLVTEVLGTSFQITPRLNGKAVEVSVRTGRVSIYNNEPTQQRHGIILTSNQKVIYDIELKTLRQGIVADPNILLPTLTKTNFKFDEISLAEVVKVLQIAYGVEIVVANAALNHCSFTGDLNELTMYQQLDLLCGSINAQYEIRGTSIFITGSGC